MWILNKQALCHWCTTPIYTFDIDDIDFFWNQQWRGFPICMECRQGLKTNGQPDYNEFRKKLGLEPEQPKMTNTLEKWL